MLNETHDPQLRSWVESANSAESDFPIQNLPHGVFRRRAVHEAFRGGVAIGDQILDMSAACAFGIFSERASHAAEMAAATSLNGLMAMTPGEWSALRLQLSRVLREGAPEADRLSRCLVPMRDAEFTVPAQIGDFTDFLTSQYHALNAGRVFNRDNPLLPNFKWMPIAYHARSSSIEVSGTDFRRPMGQMKPPGSDAPIFAPCQKLDYELEIGVFAGTGNRRGSPIPVDVAESHIFGLCLLNDWSARDIQAWEMMPLGPFMAKNFMTTISPWIVTIEALAPYRVALPREPGDPAALPYLDLGSREAGFDIQLEAWLETAGADREIHRLSRTSSRHTYWSPAQLVAHHTSNGCNLRPGDLLGTGTQSGPTRGEEGCLLELSYGGQQPLQLGSGDIKRGFVEDGDTIVLKGWCEREGCARIGFGKCAATVLPAES